MDHAEERVLAYSLATSVETEGLEEIVGGISIVIPTITLTGDPLYPDLNPDH